MQRFKKKKSVTVLKHILNKCFSQTNIQIPSKYSNFYIKIVVNQFEVITEASKKVIKIKKVFYTFWNLKKNQKINEKLKLGHEM